jgi:hypothetical protein
MRLCFTPLAPALKVLRPGCCARLNVVSNRRTRRQIGWNVLGVTALLIARRQIGYLRGVNQIEVRRLGLLGIGNVGNRYLDTLERIVIAGLGQGENITEISRGFVARSEWIKIPKQLNRLQHRRVIDNSAIWAKNRAGGVKGSRL